LATESGGERPKYVDRFLLEDGEDMEENFRWQAVYGASTVQSSFGLMEYAFRQLKPFVVLKDMH